MRAALGVWLGEVVDETCRAMLRCVVVTAVFFALSVLLEVVPGLNR